MKHFSLFALIGLSLFTVACTAPVVPTDEDGQTSSETIMETNNVLYRGILEEAGVSIYMQGTHRLTLDDGRFILLESEMVQLDDYIGERVEVLGAIRPTVEAGGQIMRVQNVRNMNASSEAASSPLSSLSSLSSLISSSPSVPTPSSAPVINEPPASVPQQQASSVAAPDVSDELTEKARTMAQADMDMVNWTLEYCSSHRQFCIPVHKNWYFKSFGATASSLWHVEIGPLEMNNLGEGPLVVNLINGSLEATEAGDGDVIVSGEWVTGYRAWEGSRHFEVRAPAILEPAVRTITQALRQSEQ
jgi:hypothetical protein